jgi:hypothetical protein
MICETCHGRQTFPPCPECGGCGIAHCCDGLIECPSGGDPTSTGKASRLPMSRDGSHAKNSRTTTSR